MLSTGYNGMPNNINDSKLPWGVESTDYLENKHYIQFSFLVMNVQN